MATTSGVPPERATPSTIESSSGGTVPPPARDPLLDGVGGALANGAAVEVDAAHPGLGREGHQRADADRALTDPVALLGEHDDRAPLGGLVGEARELRRFGQLALVDPGEREELGRLAVAERDRPGLVEQERRAVAGRLDRAPAEREHVAPHEPVHAGDADRREQAADGGRDQADEERNEHDHVLLGARVDRERLQRDDGEQEDDRQAGEQDVERDLVRRLLALGALDEGDHPVEEALTRLRRDLDDDLVGEDSRAAGDGRAVAARLADHRSGLARDRGLVDAGDALDDGAVGGDHLARGDDDLVARAKGRAGHVLERAVAPPMRDRLRSRLAQLVRLRLTAPLGDRLGEVREEDGEPQPDRDEPGEEARVGDREDGDEHAPDLDHEHDRVAHHPARIELEEALARRPEQDRAVEQRPGLVAKRHSPRCSRIGPSASTGK